MASLEVKVGKLSEKKEKGKEGLWGIRGIWDGQGKIKLEQVGRVVRERQKRHANAREVTMGVEHYHGSASLQDLRVSGLLKVGPDTCVGSGK